MTFLWAISVDLDLISLRDEVNYIGMFECAMIVSNYSLEFEVLLRII
jgi:hypothetical protein